MGDGSARTSRGRSATASAASASIACIASGAGPPQGRLLHHRLRRVHALSADRARLPAVPGAALDPAVPQPQAATTARGRLPARLLARCPERARRRSRCTKGQRRAYDRRTSSGARRARSRLGLNGSDEIEGGDESVRGDPRTGGQVADAHGHRRHVQRARTIGRALDALAAQVHEAAFEVIVVNDGSTDDTAAVATRPGVTVINLSPNSGQGTRAQRRDRGDSGRVPRDDGRRLRAARRTGSRGWQMRGRRVDEQVTMLGGPILPLATDTFNRRYVEWGNPLHPQEAELHDQASLWTRVRAALLMPAPPEGVADRVLRRRREHVDPDVRGASRGRVRGGAGDRGRRGVDRAAAPEPVRGRDRAVLPEILMRPRLRTGDRGLAASRADVRPGERAQLGEGARPALDSSPIPGVLAVACGRGRLGEHRTRAGRPGTRAAARLPAAGSRRLRTTRKLEVLDIPLRAGRRGRRPTTSASCRARSPSSDAAE